MGELRASAFNVVKRALSLVRAWRRPLAWAETAM